MRSSVLKLITKHNLLNRGQTIFVAVSGGPDSMALLHFLSTIRNEYQLTIKACHVHHHLRGEEADLDAQYVQRFCLELDIPYLQKDVHVKQYALENKIGTQLAARELRYKWFSQLLSETENSKIATGHHGDDQVETMVMSMVRGSSPLKTTGIAVERNHGQGTIIRPLLGITKAEIEHYCKEASIVPRRDSSNESSVYTRNRFRAEVLPFLKSENQNVHLHMQRKSEWEAEDQQFLFLLAEQALPTIIQEKNEETVIISRQAFLKTNIPLQRRMIQLILNYLYGKNSPSTAFIHIEQVLHIMNREPSNGEHYLPNSFLFRRDYDRCQFLKIRRHANEEHECELFIPGTVTLNSWSIRAEFAEIDLKEADNQIMFDYERVNLPLTVRHKLPNDRMHCRGMTGSKKVGRLFIDRKIAQQERERWPLVVDGSGNILWVPFLHRSRIATVESHTTRRLVLTCERLFVDE